MTAVILAGTGHRPDKITIGTRNAYDEQVFAYLLDLARNVVMQQAPAVVISDPADQERTARR